MRIPINDGLWISWRAAGYLYFGIISDYCYSSLTKTTTWKRQYRTQYVRTMWNNAKHFCTISLIGKRLVQNSRASSFLKAISDKCEIQLCPSLCHEKSGFKLVFVMAWYVRQEGRNLESKTEIDIEVGWTWLTSLWLLGNDELFINESSPYEAWHCVDTITKSSL